ncbi:MAG: uroporphyrinogen-III synthase [Candidatus Puniceispirillaceae bacterium]
MILSLRDDDLAASDCARLFAKGVPALASPSHQLVKLPFDEQSVSGAEGFILTSQQAAYALPETGKNRPVFTVGRASAASARQRGYERVRWGPSDGAALARMIQDDKDSAKLRLCWLRAKAISFDIASALRLCDFTVDEHIVYEMAAQTHMPDKVVAACRSGDISAIMALSKSQLSAAQRLLDHYALWHLKEEVMLYCVSEAVGAFAHEQGWRNITVARRKRALSVQACVICDYRHKRSSKE